MRHITFILLAIFMAFGGAQAKKMSDLKIYINPGHGGYTGNDRPIQLHPFAANDTAGYWESKSNLYKGLHMYHMLDSLGATPYLSRIKNTEADDRSLSGIDAEANSLGVDLFFSIHSNAGEDVNYPLMLYRENEIGVPRYPENVTLSKIVWKNLHSNKLPVWTHNNENICGDLDFYQYSWEGGLGVLRTLYVVGLLSEGGMHEHRPEGHRLMNDDYWWLEAWHFVRSIMEYFDTEDRFVTGNVAGIVYDDHNLRENIMPWRNHAYGRDQLAPLNFSTVELRDLNGNVVQKRTTDDMYNGVFVFRNVAPGNYRLYAVHDGYYAEEKDVTVTANEVTYCDMPLNMRRESNLAVTEYSPSITEPVSCSAAIELTFNHDIDVESFEKAVSLTPEIAGRWIYSQSYHKATFRPDISFEKNTEYVLTVSTEAKSADTHFATPNLAEPFKLTFQTQNRDRLSIIERYPQPMGEIHYKSPVLEYRFDNKIDGNSMRSNFSVTDEAGKTLSLNLRSCKYNQLTNGYGNAVMALSGSLEPGKTYTVKIGGDLRDETTIPLVDEMSYTFKAADVSVENPGTVFEDFETAANFAYNKETTTGITSTTPKAQKSTAYSFNGKAGGRLTYNFSSFHDGMIDWTYTGPVAHFNTGDILGMYVNGDFNNHEVYAIMQSGTNRKYIKITDLDFLGWQRREVKLNDLEEDFCPFNFAGIRLIQSESPYTQTGAFVLDDLSRTDADDSGVDDITTDNAHSMNAVSPAPGKITVSGIGSDVTATVYTVDGRIMASVKGSATISVPTGIYIVNAGSKSVKVIVK